MSAILAKRKTTYLVGNMAAFVLLAAVANLFLFFLPVQGASLKTSRIEIPGPVIGTVWTFLFAGMGAARWLLASSTSEKARTLSRWPFLLAVFCAAYPFYTLGLRSTTLILTGNVLTIVAALFVTWKTAQASRASSLLNSLVAVWVTFATWLTLMQMRGA